MAKPQSMSVADIQKSKDKFRTTQQAPIAQTKYCVLYLKDRREHRTPWFYKQERAQAALKIMQRRFGPDAAIIFRD